MIYLIESIGRDKHNNVKLFLKIGYSDDNVFGKRLGTYFLHNPHCELLYKIPGGTQDQEKLLHYKFKKYLAYRKEWYIDDSGEIIDFFKTHTTVESLEKELGTSNPTYFIRDITGHLTKDFIEVREGVKKLINTFYAKQLTKENSEEITEQLDEVLDKYVEEIGKTIFSIEDFKKSFTEGSLEDCLIKIEDSVLLNFLEEFNSLSNFAEKMRLLCESTLKEEELDIILDQIPLTYKKYYSTLGPARCLANGYNITYIEKEYKDTLLDKNDIVKEIYNNFQEGEVYTKKFIKEKLGEIYKSLGYNKGPKSLDILNYFEAKRSKKMENNKPMEAFKLVKKKGE